MSPPHIVSDERLIIKTAGGQGEKYFSGFCTDVGLINNQPDMISEAFVKVLLVVS